MMEIYRRLACVGALLATLAGINLPLAAQDGREVMQAFEETVEESEIVAISKQEKHQILFFMGAVLLILVFVTAGLGIAMGIYGKPVFVPHMVFAGLTATLALVHAIVAMVWFYPF